MTQAACVSISTKLLPAGVGTLLGTTAGSWHGRPEPFPAAHSRFRTRGHMDIRAQAPPTRRHHRSCPQHATEERPTVEGRRPRTRTWSRRWSNGRRKHFRAMTLAERSRGDGAPGRALDMALRPRSRHIDRETELPRRCAVACRGPAQRLNSSSCRYPRSRRSSPGPSAAS